MQIPSAKPPPPPQVASGAVYSALYDAQTAAASCGQEGGPRGSGSVALILDPSGKVSSVAMDRRFAGSEVGDCVAAAFGRVHVPKFAGRAIRVLWSFSVH